MPILNDNIYLGPREAKAHKAVRANDSIIRTQIQPLVIKTKIEWLKQDRRSCFSPPGKRYFVSQVKMRTEIVQT